MLLEGLANIEGAAKIDPQDFYEFMTRTDDKVSLVMAWSRSCGYCIAMWQVSIRFFLEDHGDECHFGHIELSEHPEFFEIMEVVGLPRLYVGVNGKVIGFVDGMLLPDNLLAIVRNAPAISERRQNQAEEGPAEQTVEVPTETVPDSAPSVVRRILGYLDHHRS